ncbi:DUF945 family protein [Salinimonas lutimaris]|uniref:DUF945 family protein n=1 Tax=Salinimonas lutimaris TaxID=914153 RepID=UPI0010C14B89|nr:DUF945 family protein [Salinimonas lutimaris]
MAKILIAGIGAAVILVGGQIYTSSAYNQQIEGQIQQLNTPPLTDSVSLEYKPVSAGMFSASDKLIVTLSPSQTASLGLPASSPLSVVVDNNCSFFPFYLTCDNRFAANDETTRELAEAFSELEYDSGWSANLLFSSVSAWLTTGSLDRDYPDGALELLPMDITTSSNLSGDKFTINADWDGMVLTSDTAQDLTINVDSLSLTADMQQNQDKVFTGDTRFSMQKMDFTRGSTGESAYASNIVYRTTTQKERDLYTVSQSLTTDKAGISLLTMGLSEQSLTALTSEMTIDGLTPEVVQYINSPGNTYAQTEQQLAEFEKAFGSQPHTMTISSLDFTYNNVPLTFSGEVFIPAFKPGQMQTLATHPALQASATLTLGDTVSSLPVYPMLQPFLQRWFEHKDARYISRIELKDKTITANGEVATKLP